MYLTDPKDGKKSVSLTFVVITFVLVTGFSVGVAINKVEGIGPLMELFYACSALYFGRRLNIGNKIFSSEKENSNESN